MFKALSRLFGSKPQTAKSPRQPIPTVAAAPVAEPAPATPSAKQQWEQTAAQPISRDASPEELAGITPGMTLDQIREQLATLYQRHNRAASSFDPQLRDDAEFMLETLAGLREKYAG